MSKLPALRVEIRVYVDEETGKEFLAEVDLHNDRGVYPCRSVNVFKTSKAKEALEYARSVFKIPLYDGHGNLIPDDFNGKEVK